MADNFLNSQEVTAEDLNNIAIDLGYGDYSHFPETPPQSAVSALNQITADLTSSGILQIGSRCNVTISGNNIVVHDGVCVFESGAKKRIENNQVIGFIEGGINYIYLLNNTSGNVIRLVNSLIPPSTGDYVMLAEVSEDKTVRLNRKFSRAKVTALGSSEVVEKQFTESGGELTQIYYAVTGSGDWDDRRIADTAYSKNMLIERGYDSAHIYTAFIYAVVEGVDTSKYSYVICYSPDERDGWEINPKRGNAVYDLKKDYFIFSNSLDHNGGRSLIDTSWADFNCYPKSAWFKVIDGNFTMLVSGSDTSITKEYKLLFI